jgi:hypothetical protein
MLKKLIMTIVNEVAITKNPTFMAWLTTEYKGLFK